MSLSEKAVEILAGHFLTKTVDRFLAWSLRRKLLKVTADWVRTLPQDKWAYAGAILPAAILPVLDGREDDVNVAERPALARLTTELSAMRPPTTSDWEAALREQWEAQLRSGAAQPLFKQDYSAVASDIHRLAQELDRTCTDDPKLFQRGVLWHLREQHASQTHATNSALAPTAELDREFFQSQIDTLTDALQLEHWDWFIDNALRGVVHERFLSARGQVNERVLGAIWPERLPELSAAIREVAEAFDQWLEHYMKHAWLPPQRESFVPDQFYKMGGRYNPNYHRDVERFEKWERKTHLLLCYYAAKLNDFADAVRAYHDPGYFRVYGRFLVKDYMGIYSGGHGRMWDVDGESLARILQGIDTEKSPLPEVHDIMIAPEEEKPESE